MKHFDNYTLDELVEAWEVAIKHPTMQARETDAGYMFALHEMDYLEEVAHYIADRRGN